MVSYVFIAELINLHPSIRQHAGSGQGRALQQGGGFSPVSWVQTGEKPVSLSSRDIAYKRRDLQDSHVLRRPVAKIDTERNCCGKWCGHWMQKHVSVDIRRNLQ